MGFLILFGAVFPTDYRQIDRHTDRQSRKGDLVVIEISKIDISSEDSFFVFVVNLIVTNQSVALGVPKKEK